MIKCCMNVCNKGEVNEEVGGGFFFYFKSHLSQIYIWDSDKIIANIDQFKDNNLQIPRIK